MRFRVLVLPALALLALAPPLAAQPSAAARVQHVLLISIDGARPDGLRAAGIAPILQEASYSLTAQTTVPPMTAPSHMSMVSGVGPEKHGVRDNEWRPGRPHPTVPTIFSVAKQAGLRTALFTQKVYVPVIADPRYMDRVELVRWRPATLTADLIEAASAYLRAAQPHVALVHISEPDAIGHAEGWMSFGYIQALRRGVAGVATLRQVLRDAGMEDRALVIVTADHGGIGRDHAALVPEVLTIPWIVLGRGVRRDVMIERPIVTHDTAATILYALGLAIPPGWDGKPVVDVFAWRPVAPLAGWQHDRSSSNRRSSVWRRLVSLAAALSTREMVRSAHHLSAGRSRPTSVVPRTGYGVHDGSYGAVAARRPVWVAGRRDAGGPGGRPAPAHLPARDDHLP